MNCVSSSPALSEFVSPDKSFQLKTCHSTSTDCCDSIDDTLLSDASFRRLESTLSNQESEKSFGSGEEVSEREGWQTAVPTHKGIKLAEMGEWEALLKLLELSPSIAQQKDDYGMLPLHWACTVDEISPCIIKALLKAYPEGILIRNSGHYLPIHIAVRADVKKETLLALCEAGLSTLFEETPSGKTPFMLAKEAKLENSLLELLWNAEQEYAQLALENGLSSFKSLAGNEKQKHPLQRDAHDDICYSSDTKDRRSTCDGISMHQKGETSLNYIEDSTCSGMSAQTVALGDNIRASACHVCRKKFGVLRRRFQCGRCMKAVCRKHVAGKIVITKERRRNFFCNDCFEEVPAVLSCIGHTEFHSAKSLSRPSIIMDAEDDGKAYTYLSQHASIECTASRQCRKYSSDNLSTLTSDSAEITTLHQQIGDLEGLNEKLSCRVETQEKQYHEAMLLLSETMSRIADLESRIVQDTH